MKTRTRLTILVGLAFMVAVLVAAQTPRNTTDANATRQATSTNSVMPIANMQDTHSSEHANKMHAMHTLSADDAYKQNCTRCHSEVPQANARTTKTILRHMRVRANITQDQAKAILEYLTQ